MIASRVEEVIEVWVKDINAKDKSTVILEYKPIEKKKLRNGKTYPGILTTNTTQYISYNLYYFTWNGIYFETNSTFTKSEIPHYSEDNELTEYRFIPLEINLKTITMGTNYYIQRENGEEIHIGKASFGWQFIFQTNPEYYESTRVGVNRFLKLNKNNLYDEYGERVRIEDFWDMVEKKKDGLTLKEYYDYPDCLQYYDRGEKIYIPEHQRDRVYEDLPQDLRTVERFIGEESVVDGLVFHDCEFS